MAAVQEHVRQTIQVNGANTTAQHEVHREAQQTQRRTGSKVLNGISLFVCCAISFASVWYVASKGAQVYRISYANTRLQTKINQQDAKNAALSAQVDQLKQPSRILRMAMAFHMEFKKPLIIPSTVPGK